MEQSKQKVVKKVKNKKNKKKKKQKANANPNRITLRRYLSVDYKQVEIKLNSLNRKDTKKEEKYLSRTNLMRDRKR